MISSGSSPSLWVSVFKLLRLRLTLWVSSFRRAKIRAKIAQIFLAVFILGLGVGAFFLSSFLLRFLRSPEITALIEVDVLIAALPTVILAVGFLMILLSNFGVLLQALYLSRDMDFLIAAPLPMRAVFLAKFIQALLPNFGLFCLFGLPILFGLGASQGYNFFYYPLLVLMMIALAFTAAGLASILVMAVVKVVPARRVAEVLGFLGGILGITLSQAGNLAQSMQLSQEQLSGALWLLSSLNQPWSPFAWVSHGLTDIGLGNWASGTLYLTLTLVVALALFTFTLLLAERLYYTGWASMQVSTQKKSIRPARSIKSAPARAGAIRLLPAAIRALVIKDFVLLRRDLNNLSQLITPLIFGVILIIVNSRNLSRAEPGLAEQVSLGDLSLYANIAYSLFISWFLLMNLASTSFAREGKNYWLIFTAPIRARDLLIAKFIVSYLPALVISLLFLSIANLLRPGDLSHLPFSFIVIAFSLAGLTGILMAFSVTGANMDWEDPRKMGVRGAQGCLMSIASVVYSALALGLFIGPAVLWAVLQLGNSWVSQVIGLVLGTSFSLGCAILPLWAVRNRVALIGQPGG